MQNLRGTPATTPDRSPSPTGSANSRPWRVAGCMEKDGGFRRGHRRPLVQRVEVVRAKSGSWGRETSRFGPWSLQMVQNRRRTAPGSTFRDGGGGGIRTHGTLTRTTVFETAPFDHSGTPPRRDFKHLTFCLPDSRYRSVPKGRFDRYCGLCFLAPGRVGKALQRQAGAAVANPAGDLIHVQAAVDKQRNVGMPQGVTRTIGVASWTESGSPGRCRLNRSNGNHALDPREGKLAQRLGP